VVEWLLQRSFKQVAVVLLSAFICTACWQRRNMLGQPEQCCLFASFSQSYALLLAAPRRKLPRLPSWLQRRQKHQQPRRSNMCLWLSGAFNVELRSHSLCGVTHHAVLLFLVNVPVINGSVCCQQTAHSAF
jgi:hypothetical protein